MVAFLVAACTGAAPLSTIESQAPGVTGDGWQTASPADAGLDAATLAAMTKDIQDGGFENLYSVLIVKDGRLAFEQYFRGHDERSVDYVASVTKSVTSILVGIAIKQGAIKGPDESLAELLPAYAQLLNADPLKRKLQLRHLLTMTSGIQWDEASFPYGSPQNDATRMERSPDAVKFILGRPIVREPGTQFQYSGANAMLLSAILQEATGMTAADFAKRYLFDPLGIRDYYWDTYADGHTHTDGGLSLRPRDMAKIGQLMLNHGQWNGVQIVAPEWVALSTQAHTTAQLWTRYGYLWWRENQPHYLETVQTYFAAGYGGQTIFVYPDQQMIVVFTSDRSDHNVNAARIARLLTRYIYPAAFPAWLSKALLGCWAVLTVCGLVLLMLKIAKGQLRGAGRPVYWVLASTVCGPLGSGAYLLSHRKPGASKAPGSRALGISVLVATGNVTGLILLVVFQVLFFPQGSVVLLAVPAAFLVVWLALLAPLAAAARGLRYGQALRRTLLPAFVSSCSASLGMLAVAVLLSLRWFLNGVDLASPMFWVMMTACAIASAIVAYPSSLWMARRAQRAGLP
jgi:CubicO group peptidase (beta-lactamase class C family)